MLIVRNDCEGLILNVFVLSRVESVCLCSRVRKEKEDSREKIEGFYKFWIYAVLNSNIAQW